MLHAYFLRNIKNKNLNIFFILFGLTLVCILSISYLDTFLHTEIAPDGIVSFELAKNVQTSTKIIQDWMSKDVLVVAGLSIGLDFVFILSYVLFIAFLLFITTYNNKTWIYVTGKILIWAVLFAGFFDVIENVSLIMILLKHTSQILPLLAFYMAFFKFVILIISVLFIAITAVVNLLKKLL